MTKIRTNKLPRISYESPWMYNAKRNIQVLVQREAEYLWAIGRVANYSYIPSPTQEKIKWTRVSIVAFAKSIYSQLMP